MKKNAKKTVILAVLASASFVYSAIFHFDIEPKVLLDFFTMSLVLVVVAMVFALIGAGLIRLLRR